MSVFRQSNSIFEECNLKNCRYYLKNNSRSDPLVPDDLAPEILKEAQCQLLNLNAHVVACQLTLQVRKEERDDLGCRGGMKSNKLYMINLFYKIVQDFATFSSIEPTEYVDNLFQLESRYDLHTLLFLSFF